MTDNVGIARNSLNAPQYKQKTKQLWADAVEKFNQLGPPVKTLEGWKKVWKDYKYSLKIKLHSKRFGIKRKGNGEQREIALSQLELAVVDLLDLNTVIHEKGMRKYTDAAVTKHIRHDDYDSPPLSFVAVDEESIKHEPDEDVATELRPDSLSVDETPGVRDTIYVINDTTGPPQPPSIHSSEHSSQPIRTNSMRSARSYTIDCEAEIAGDRKRFYAATMKYYETQNKLLRDIKRVKEEKLQFVRERAARQQRDRTRRLRLSEAELQLKREQFDFEKMKFQLSEGSI